MGNLVALRGHPVPDLPDALHDLRATGLVRPASTAADDVARMLPVAPELARLLPGGGLRRGSTVAVAPSGSAGGVGAPTGRAVASAGAPGSTSLLLALIASASAAGAWSTVVGLPDLGMAAAAEAGVALSRFALVPRPGPDWVGVVAALLDGVDIVVVATPGPVRATVTGRLAARARQRGSVLVAFGEWDGVDLALTVTGGGWHGLGRGGGRLRHREVEVVASGRGAAALTRRARFALPADPLSAGQIPAGQIPAGPFPVVGGAAENAAGNAAENAA